MSKSKKQNEHLQDQLVQAQRQQLIKKVYFDHSYEHEQQIIVVFHSSTPEHIILVLTTHIQNNYDVVQIKRIGNNILSIHLPAKNLVPPLL